MLFILLTFGAALARYFETTSLVSSWTMITVSARVKATCRLSPVMWNWSLLHLIARIQFTRASNKPSRRFHNHGEGLSWLKAPTI